jgi:putative transposase
MDQRIEFVLKAMQTLNFRALCQEYGVSTKTGYKWKQRLINGGLEGIKEESRRQKEQSQPII